MTKKCTKCLEHLDESCFHLSVRDGLKSQCKKCRRDYDQQRKEKKAEYDKKYREENIEKILLNKEKRKEQDRERWKKYYQANKEKISKRKSARYFSNLDFFKAIYLKRVSTPEGKAQFARYNKNSRLRYHDRVLARNAKRRAKIISCGGSYTESDISYIFKMQRGLCASCETKLIISGKGKFHVDHIMPLKLGGSNWPSNLQCLCPACNLRKNAKHPLEWANQNGKLL